MLNKQQICRIEEKRFSKFDLKELGKLSHPLREKAHPLPGLCPELGNVSVKLARKEIPGGRHVACTTGEPIRRC
jgi:hypothetical protein